MTFISNIFKKLRPNEDKPKPKSLPSVVIEGVNPSDLWVTSTELGDGAFGKVYKATNIETNQVAALKSIELSSDEELEDLIIEIEILSEFKHPNIVQMHSAFFYEKRLWLYLEFCDGGAVDTIMRVLDKPLTEVQIKFITREVICGLEFLHKNLIIHRDLKAGNILITHNYEIRLADFGVSARMASISKKRTTFIGTPYWMAPEVIACETFKDNPYDMASDVWSFGITLIEFAEMLPPFNELNPMRVLLKILKADPPQLSHPESWSPALNSLLRRCLQKSPEQRPTMADLKLDPFIADVTDADRFAVKMLLCELKADVEETVEDIAQEDLPDIPPAMISAEVSDVLARSLQVQEDLGRQLSTPLESEVGMDLASYEDVEFNVISCSPPKYSEGVSFEEDMPGIEGAVSDGARDVDFTSMAFTPVEIAEDGRYSPKTETSADQPKVFLTSFGPDLSAYSQEEDEFSWPRALRVPDFALEVSHGVDDEEEEEKKNGAFVSGSPPETCELPSPRMTTPVQSTPKPSPRKTLQREQAANEITTTSKGQAIEISPLPVASVLRRCPTQFRSSTRVRHFVVDGEEHTTTSKKILLAANSRTPVENKFNTTQRRVNRNLRELAKENKRRERAFNDRISQQKHQLDQKLVAEYKNLRDKLTQKEESLGKDLKSKMENLELQFAKELEDLRNKNAQTEKLFLEQLKTQIDGSASSRNQRKGILRDVRDIICTSSTSRPAFSSKGPPRSPTSPNQWFSEALQFRQSQDKKMTEMMSDLKEKFKMQKYDIACKNCSDRYNISKDFTTMEGKMTQRHINMRYQLERSQAKDAAVLSRQYIAKQFACRLLELREDANAERSQLLANLAQEKVAYVKKTKASQKQRIAERLKMLTRDGAPPVGTTMKSAQAKIFEEEIKRTAEAIHQLDILQSNQLQALDHDIMSRFAELDQQQSISKIRVANQESSRIKEIEDECRRELKAHSERIQREIMKLDEEFENGSCPMDRIGAPTSQTSFLTSCGGSSSSHGLQIVKQRKQRPGSYTPRSYLHSSVAGYPFYTDNGQNLNPVNRSTYPSS